MAGGRLQVADEQVASAQVVGGAMMLVVAALVVLSAAPLALAHGGGTPQLVDAPAGPYHVYAWTNPDPARVGTLHVTVALVDPAANQPIMGADVQVRVTPLDADSAAAPIAAQATHDKATIKTYYETDLEVPAAGPWQVAINYMTPQGGGSAGFDLAVQEKTFTNWLLIGGVALVVVLLAWYFWPRKSKTTNAA